MGEPLDNPEAVFGSIDIITNEFAYNLGRRKITVSTSGLVPMIPKIAEAKARLAVSLNASNDEIRDYVMPINKKYPLKELLAACREYTRNTKDRVTFEYVLLKGVTDRLEDADRLRDLLRSVPCKINLIPFNEHPGSGFYRPSDATVHAFQQRLMDFGFQTIVRRTMGRDIYAACGQLTSKFEGRPDRLSLDQASV
jgi:23S rRNA (adenine2503-C2)-methyltransferase